MGRSMKRDPTLPRWIARDKREGQMMHDWVNARLDEEDEAQARRRIDALLLRLGAPPENLKGEGDRQAMIDWAAAMIDEDDEARSEALLFDLGVPPEHREKYFKWRREGGYELEAAKHGFIEPARELIRQRWPLLARLAQPPKLKRGEKYHPELAGIRTAGQLLHKADVKAAAKDVGRVRELWRAHYGKQNRRPADGPSAIDIAAERHGVSTDAVASHLKRAFLRTKSRI